VPSTDAVLDLGGVAMAAGGLTAYARVLRADRPVGRVEGLSDAALLAAGVNVVIDLRSAKEERRTRGHLADVEGVQRYHVPLGPPDPEEGVQGRKPGSLSDLYRSYLTDGGRSLLNVLELVAAHRGDTVLVHCRAGRDRTGIVAAWLLALAGVPTRHILADQAVVGGLTAEETSRRRESWTAKRRDPAAFDALNSFYVLALARALSYAEHRYGGVGGYLMAQGASTSLVADLSRVLHPM
jgi:protein-tyrosine phosphatase